MGPLDRTRLATRAGQLSTQATLLQREAVLQQWAVALASHLQEHSTAQEQLERDQEEVSIPSSSNHRSWTWQSIFTKMRCHDIAMMLDFGSAIHVVLRCQLLQICQVFCKDRPPPP